MKAALYIAAIITIATASPSGYYHQQYNYKTSSSSYRNNELQHKTDDQGYYSKDGDLEGRVKPKVSSNSEHSEYVNPRLGEQGSSGYDSGSDLQSQGNLLANSFGSSVGGSVASGYHSGSQYENGLHSEGLASSDYISGVSGQSGSYGSGSESSYESANLRTLGSHLQNDLHNEIQSALVSQSHQANIAELEAELRRNLTSRLNQVLLDRFGTQTIRGGQSYSLTGGRLQVRPNYDQRELELLQRQIERSLLDELRQEYNYRTSHSSQQTVNQQNYERYESTTTYRPNTYRPIYPNLNVISPQEKYPTYQTQDSQHSQYNRVASNVQYTQVPNAISITTVASNVQRDLNNQLNRLLEEARLKYFSDNSQYTSSNTASILERLKQELRQNLTYTLEEELRRNFGTQSQRNGYMFSVGSEHTNQYNYNTEDLENLKRQVEENLITKLSRDFEAARQNWISTQQHSQSQQTFYGQSQSNDYNYGASNNLRYEYSTPRYADNDYYRPTAASIVPLISSGVKGNQYHGVSGSHQSNYESSSGSSNIAQIQRQLQTDLSGQLQAALTQNKAYLNRYSSTGEGQATFDEAYRRLYEELQRNLTQQLQSYEAGGSSYSNSYGSVSENQLAQLRSQLQRSLASQLQQGLQQSYSASASFSASSGSSASAGSGAYSGSNSGGYYRGTRGSDNYQYGQYKAGGGYLMEGEDCQGDDPLAHQYHRSKRSNGYRSRPLGLSTNTGVGFNSRGTYGGYYGSHTPVGQEEDESETIQPHIGQEIDDTDDTQQIEVDHGFNIGQEEDNSDDTQQIQVQHGFSTIGLGSQNFQSGSLATTDQKQNAIGTGIPFPQRGVDTAQPIRANRRPVYQDTHLGVQGESGYQGNIKPNIQSVQRGDITSSHGSQFPIGQEEDDSDNTQQIEDNSFSGVEIGSQTNHPRPDITGIRQISTPTGSIDDASHRIQSGQRIPNQRTYATVVSSGSQGRYQPTYGGPTPGNERNNLIGQEEDNSDDTQQTEIDAGFGTADWNKPQNSQVNSFGIGEPLHRNTGLSGSGNIGVANQEGLVSTPRTSIQSNLNQYLPGNLYPQNSFGQQVDDTDTTGIEYTSNPKVNQFDTAQHIKPSDLPIRPIRPTRPSSKPTLDNSGFQPQSTPKNPLLQFATQNIIPETEPLLNTFDGTGSSSSQQPVPTFSQKPVDVGSSFNIQPNVQPRPQPNSFGGLVRNEPVNVNIANALPTHQVMQLGTLPSVQQVDIPVIPELKAASTQLQDNLYNEIEEIVKHDLPSSIAPNQLYKDTLYNLRTNISRECQKLLDDNRYSYLNIQQKDVTVLEKYVESLVIQKLEEKFKTSGYFRGESVGFQSVPQHSLNFYNNYDNQRQFPRYRPKPLASSNTFLQREIDSQDNQYHLSHNTNVFNPVQFDEKPKPSPVNPLESDSLVNHNVFPKTTPRQGSVVRSTTPLPTGQTVVSPVDTDRQILHDADNEADWLIQNLKNSLTNQPRENPSNVGQESVDSNGENKYSPEPQNTIIRVKLENITPEQLRIIEEIEEDFSSIINLAVQQEYTSSNLDHRSNYELYQISRKKLEKEIKETLSDTIKGTNLENINLKKYASLINQKFVYGKIPDVQKYLEIRLIKKIRAQLKLMYNIETTDATYEIPGGSVPQKSTTPKSIRNEVPVVRLENVTPEQLKIIKEIEENFSNTINIAIQQDYTTSNLDHRSKYELYRIARNKLEQEIKETLSDTIEGTNLKNIKYSRLINQKFEQGKIPDLQKYLEIRLIKKIRAQLKILYNIETTDETYEIPSESIPQKSTTPLSISNEEVVVRLENVTPEQLNIIEEIEEDFSNIINLAIQQDYTSSNLDHRSKYELYRIARNKLEQEIKEKLSDTIKGANLRNINLKKYSRLINQKFDHGKIPDLQKYIEIKLIKIIRTQLKTLYDIEPTEDSYEIIESSSSIQAYTTPKPITTDRVVVRLENITPEQLKIIEEIEEDISSIFAITVQHQYESTISDHRPKYELYQISLNKLEQEIKDKLSNTIEGTLNHNEENISLKKYSRLINQKFDYGKIPDLQKYLEIKLIKKVRAQLKRLYNIETTDGTYKTPGDTSTQEHASTDTATSEQHVVRLENITPAQLKIIRQIEEDINKQIEAAIQIRISSLRESHSSNYQYQQSLDALELELKNNITETIQRLCEPGLSQHSDLISSNFDRTKINDLEKYLQIRLINKLRSNITHYSNVEATTNSRVTYHSTSSLHYSHGYNNNYRSSDENAEQGSAETNPGSSYRPPLLTSSHHGSVKGGKNSNNQHVPQSQSGDTEYLPNISSEPTNNLDTTEPTTPAANWWKRFSSKVKQGAHNLKDKITGNS